MSAEFSNTDYIEMDAPQELEYMGTFGGHCPLLCFLAAVEGFLCLWLLIAIQIFMGVQTTFISFDGNAMQGAFILPAFGFCFHYVVQSVIGLADPGRVIEILRSLEDCMEDEECAKVLNELRGIAPKLTVHAEAFHKTSGAGSGTNRVHITHIDAEEEEEFRYAAWKDTSGRVVGLEKYKIVAIEVVVDIECTDQATDLSLGDLHQRLMAACYEKVRLSSSTRSRGIFSVEHPIYPVAVTVPWGSAPTGSGVTGAKVFVTRSRGAASAFWLTADFYDRCRFIFPFLGTIYRILFLTSVINLRFTLKKEISTKEQSGAGWSKN